VRVPRFLTVAAFAAVLMSLACNDTTSTAVSTITVHVLDANNAGVPLVNVDLYKVLNGGGLLWRASRTSSDGIAIFGDGIEAGDYYVHVSFIANYHLTAGETNDRPVTVQGGDNVAVTFQVETADPGR
jgi:5-hydroxyisourate hydrolase-like protein (transthyretin family)